DYEINWHLRSVINPTSEDLKSRSAKVKNRRRAFMDKLMNETLLRRAEEALLMEKIRMEQQILSVDEMDWVGNERREEEEEEQEEEQEEEEDEDDEEVEEGKHGDANVHE
ncbi:hypothetical protein Tco_0419917, partial [Tanacetum coccineum]